MGEFVEALSRGVVSALVLGSALACDNAGKSVSSASPDSNATGSGGNTTGSGGNTGGSGGNTGGGATSMSGGGGIELTAGAAGEASSNAECQPCPGPVPLALSGQVLAVVFDVSASMGSGQLPYFSQTLKWDPTLAALKSFFTDPDSAGTLATLSFFPNELASLTGEATNTSGGPECTAMEYETPDVALTPLPAETFGSALDAITPLDADGWRNGTPTLAALEGTLTTLESRRRDNSMLSYRIVLITDGMPALCDSTADSITTVAAAAAAAVSSVLTYVIAVENPATDEEPNPPDSVSDLDRLAAAGGTNTAYKISTGEPAQTTAMLLTALESIRAEEFTCLAPLPEPPAGQPFDPYKVNIQYSSTQGTEVFDYDPACTTPNAWHYDDDANPTQIALCPDLCSTIYRAQLSAQNNSAQLEVAFGCTGRLNPNCD